MKFDRNQTHFPTMLHRDIYMSALRIIPTEISLVDIEEKEPVLAESAKQYHAFMLDLYGDMYENPEVYGMKPGAYEAFTNGRKYHALMRKNVTKAKTAADQSGAEIGCYMGILNQLGTRCMIVDGRCTLSAEDFSTLREYKFLSKREQANAIDPDIVFAALARNTLTFEATPDGRVEVKCEKYPKMFEAHSRLSKSVDESVKHPVSAKLKYYFCQNSATLDFRQIYENYYPTYEDYIRFLPDESLSVVQAVNEMAKEYKLKLRLWVPYMLIYEHKKEGIITVWVHDQWPLEPGIRRKDWQRCSIVRIGGSCNAEYLQSIADEGDAFLKQFFKHLNYCSCCTPSHCTPDVPRADMFGRHVRICGEPAAVFTDPKTSDLSTLRRFLELKMQDVEYQKTKK